MKKLMLSVLAALGLYAGQVQAASNPLVAIETEKGTIVVELRPDAAPTHVQNMLKLVQEGFYDGVYWHRVIPGFVAQAGDATLVGREQPSTRLSLEISDLKHTRGALGMARAEALDSASTQFYITTAAHPSLDGKYTVFGYVTRGMDVVDNLVQGDKIVRAYVMQP